MLKSLGFNTSYLPRVLTPELNATQCLLGTLVQNMEVMINYGCQESNLFPFPLNLKR